jgi:PPOX class probable F420-dependent enzyme
VNPIDIDELTIELIAGANQAHIATLMPDGAPHSVPVWTGWEGDHLAFITGRDSRKARNIARDPRIALSVTDRGNPARMASLRGLVVDVVDGEAAWTVVDRLAMKYIGVPYPRIGARSAFLVQVTSATSAAFG